MENNTSKKVFTEIAGKAYWSGFNLNMRQIIVDNDPEFRKYWVRPGSEIQDGTLVSVGDQLGFEGDMPMVLMLGPLRYSCPKEIPNKSKALYSVDGDFFGADGNFYTLKIRYTLTENGEEFGDPYYLEKEMKEEDFFHADDSILNGKTIENISTVYGIRENETPAVANDLPLKEWLESIRRLGKIPFICPYQILNGFEHEIDDFTRALEKKMLPPVDENNSKETKKEKGTWNTFDYMRQSIADHDKSCLICLDEALEAGGIMSEDLRKRLLYHFEGIEDYSSCEKLAKLPVMTNASLSPSATNVLEYENYLDSCYNVIKEFDWLALYGRTKEQGLELTDRMVERYTKSGDTEKVMRLVWLKNIIVENKTWCDVLNRKPGD